MNEEFDSLRKKMRNSASENEKFQNDLKALENQHCCFGE